MTCSPRKYEACLKTCGFAYFILIPGGRCERDLVYLHWLEFEGEQGDAENFCEMLSATISDFFLELLQNVSKNVT